MPSNKSIISIPTAPKLHQERRLWSRHKFRFESAEGHQIFYETSQSSKNVYEFLAGLRFEQQGKLAELYIERREKSQYRKIHSVFDERKIGICYSSCCGHMMIPNLKRKNTD